MLALLLRGETDTYGFSLRLSHGLFGFIKVVECLNRAQACVNTVGALHTNLIAQVSILCGKLKRTSVPADLIKRIHFQAHTGVVYGEKLLISISGYTSLL
jgi:hypothetical protein